VRRPDDQAYPELVEGIHALVDADGLPIALKLTAGQAHDGRSAADILDTLGYGDVLLADRAYDSDALRTELAARGAWANIKSMPNRKRRHCVQRLPLSLPQPRRALRQQTQTVPSRDNPL
jgi:transposase